MDAEYKHRDTQSGARVTVHHNRELGRLVFLSIMFPLNFVLNASERICKKKHNNNDNNMECVF